MDWGPGYREFAPPEALRPSVSCLWVGVAPPDGVQGEAQRLM